MRNNYIYFHLKMKISALNPRLRNTWKTNPQQASISLVSAYSLGHGHCCFNFIHKYLVLSPNECVELKIGCLNLVCRKSLANEWHQTS